MKDLRLEDSEKPITEEQYKLFLKEFNLKLPDSYKQFILKYNGGYPKISAFGNPYEDGFTVDYLGRIAPEKEGFFETYDSLSSTRLLIDTHQIEEQNIPKHLYPFGASEGNHTLCISMKDKDFGSIYVYYLDGTAHEPAFLTSSFEQFINALEDSEDYEEDDY